jgi:hypothetical protein
VSSRYHAVPQPARCDGRSVFQKDAHDTYPGVAHTTQSINARRCADSLVLRTDESLAPSVIPVIADRATRPSLLPKLGDVTPIEPDPKVQRVVTDVSRRIVPATGQILDVIA